MKNVSEMTQDELVAAAEKLRVQAEKRKAYSKNRKANLTPEQKEARKEYGRQKRANDKAILERVAKLGKPASEGETPATEPTTSAPEASTGRSSKNRK